MTIRRTRTAALAVAALMVTTLAACSSEHPSRDPGMTAIVVGARSNMPAPRLVGDGKNWLDDAASNRDTLFIIGVSGRPEQLHKEKLSSECSTVQACDGFRHDTREKVDALIARVTPNAPEADTFGAVLEAVNQFGTFTGHRQIIIIDNGLQTSGELQLQAPGAFGADPAAIVKQVSGDARVKGLAGVKVLLSGIGDTAAPQEELVPARKQQLIALWKGLMSAAGADVQLEPTQLRGNPVAGPAVAVVPISDPPPPTTSVCVTLREDQVGFVADKAVFRDSAVTRKTLEPVAAQLRSSGIPATVTGTTALPEDPPYELSTARAKAVIDLLVELGVSRSKLTAIGVGTNFSGYRKPVGADGRFNETLAVQYRLVIIQPAGARC